MVNIPYIDPEWDSGKIRWRLCFGPLDFPSLRRVAVEGVCFTGMKWCVFQKRLENISMSTTISSVPKMEVLT